MRTRSTTSCGNNLLCASGCASVLPSVTASRAFATASLMSELDMTCSVIFSAVKTGTPFCSSVPSVRVNWPNTFNFTTFPTTGAFMRHSSSLRAPAALVWKRLNKITSTTMTSPSSHQ